MPCFVLLELFGVRLPSFAQRASSPFHHHNWKVPKKFHMMSTVPTMDAVVKAPHDKAEVAASEVAASGEAKKCKKAPRAKKPFPTALALLTDKDRDKFTFALEKDPMPKSKYFGDEFDCAQTVKLDDGSDFDLKKLTLHRNSSDEKLYILQFDADRPAENTPLLGHESKSHFDSDAQLTSIEVESVVLVVSSITGTVDGGHMLCWFVGTIANSSE
jgi:hypothetical protein